MPTDSTMPREEFEHRFAQEISRGLNITIEAAQQQLRQWEAEFMREADDQLRRTDEPAPASVAWTPRITTDDVRPRPVVTNDGIESGRRTASDAALPGQNSVSYESVFTSDHLSGSMPMPKLTTKKLRDIGKKVAPQFTFPTFEMERYGKTFDNVVDAYCREVEYKLRWIFNRVEKEGLGRDGRYGVLPFSPDDLEKKLKGGYEDGGIKTYNWKISASFIARLQKLNNDPVCLRVIIIEKATGKAVCYVNKIWDGSRFQDVSPVVWAQ